VADRNIQQHSVFDLAEREQTRSTCKLRGVVVKHPSFGIPDEQRGCRESLATTSRKETGLWETTSPSSDIQGSWTPITRS